MIPYREKKSPYDAGPDNRNEPDQLRRHHFPRLDSYERCRSNSDISDRPLPPPNLNGQELNRSSSTSQRQRSNTYDWSPAATHGGTNHQHVNKKCCPICDRERNIVQTSRTAQDQDIRMKQLERILYKVGSWTNGNEGFNTKGKTVGLWRAHSWYE
ncbi:MAG: hypothetical protein LQ340_005899 [Diploschistes diacapsis]|nr:MAG: hypothetical protein LQ340_005899 [Diploschistes diacapsis]